MTRNGYYDKIEMNGVDVTEYITDYKVYSTKKLSQIDTAKIKALLTLTDAVTLISGLEVKISRGKTTSTDDYLIKGYIKHYSEQEGLIVIDVEGRLGNYKRKYFTYSYDKNIDVEAGELPKIFKDICEDGGLTCSIVNSTDIIADKFISNDNTRLERMSRIASWLNWQMYDDYDNDYIRLEPQGYITYSTPLIVGSNIINKPFWEEDLEPMRNKIKIKGAQDEDTRIELFNGTGAQTTFTVTYTPEITEVKVGGVLKTRGVPGASSTYDYYVDKELKRFIFTTAPASGTNNVEVKYTTMLPRPVIGQSFTSQTKYGLTQEEVYTFQDIKTVDDAKSRLKQLLLYLQNAFIKTTLNVVDANNLNIGNVVNVTDSYNSKYNGSYVVTDVIYQYPEVFDIVKVGNTDFNIQDLFNSIDSRIRELENSQITNQQLLINLIQLVRSFIFRRRYTKIDIQNIAGETGIYGHPSFGIYGTAKYGSTAGSGFILGHTTFGILGTGTLGETSPVVTTIKLIPGNNIIQEYVYDTKFDGTGTATWNTTDKKIEFTSGQSRTTDAYAIGTTYQYYTLSVGSQTGTIVYEISSDNGTTWETASPNTRTSFTTLDNSGVKLRMTESASSTAEIASTYLNNGLFDKPAFKIILEE